MLTKVAAACGVLLLLALTAVAILIARAGSPNDAAVAAIDATIGRPISTDPRNIPFTVESGDTAATVADHLASKLLIRSAIAFRLIVRFEGFETNLQAGNYELRPNMSTTELVASMVQGRMAGGFLTIPEGWRLGEIADALERAGVTPRADFVSFVEHPPASAVAGAWPVPDGRSLEGYLFPDSYRFDRHTAASEIGRRMVDDFGKHASLTIRAAIEANGLTDYQGVTLASIVEREAVTPAERPIIASVFYNRLKRGMKLQADPTVQYALIDDAMASSGYWKRSLTFADLANLSPYNTYQVSGLPPGPICNPGLDSLAAVAHPATTDYLYFVAKSDGTHAFARTLHEQEANVARYQS
jgi:UPF0755 protein